MSVNRRHFLASGMAGAAAAAGCRPAHNAIVSEGGFVGTALERGHRLRDLLQSNIALPPPSHVHRTGVVIAGGGVAGLAAARALRQRGMEDFALLELEDTAGGNSRGGVTGGFACPLGAHYLPVPGDDAPEVQNFLEELGLRQRVAGRWQYAEQHLCHSPQERLYFQDEWQEGLLPTQGVGPATLAQYRKFASLVQQLRQTARWSVPVRPGAVNPAQMHLATLTFSTYLQQNGLTDSHLGWYLDYCCRDEYGAGSATVSAWAGVHYFASRHGFHPPGADNGERDSVLTWPEGNGWLTQRLAQPLGERLRSGQIVVRIAAVRGGVEVDALDARSGELERWVGQRAIVALPVFVAAWVVENPPDFLRQAAAAVVYAPWLVANLQLDAPLHDRPGAPPSWDNVLYGSPGLGYVDAMHQSLQSVPAATVLTYYRALGSVEGGANAGRKLLQNSGWLQWRDQILAELSVAHPDLVHKTRRMDVTRYGHAMAIPIPHIQGQIGLRAPQSMRGQLSKSERIASGYAPRWDRLTFAHSDWAGYSVFEEAFTMGHAAGSG